MNIEGQYEEVLGQLDCFNCETNDAVEHGVLWPSLREYYNCENCDYQQIG
jgi:hypothetical protein